MKQTVHLHDFREAFKDLGRDNQFTYDGLRILFVYLEDLEQGGDEYELDVIAVCCEYAEQVPKDIANDYSINVEGLTTSEIGDVVRERLNDEGVMVGETVINTFIYRQF